MRDKRKKGISYGSSVLFQLMMMGIPNDGRKGAKANLEKMRDMKISLILDPKIIFF